MGKPSSCVAVVYEEWHPGKWFLCVLHATKGWRRSPASLRQVQEARWRGERVDSLANWARRQARRGRT